MSKFSRSMNLVMDEDRNKKLQKENSNDSNKKATSSKSKNNNNDDNDQAVESVKDITSKLTKFKNNASLMSVALDVSKIGLKKLVKIMGDVNLMNLEEKLVFEIDKGDSKNHYPITENTIKELTKGNIDESQLFEDDGEAEVIETSGAQMVNLMNIYSHVLKLQRIPKPKLNPNSRLNKKTNPAEAKSRSKPAGAFFKFLNKTHFDFSKYGIHREIKHVNYNDNCLYLALKHGGMSEKN